METTRLFKRNAKGDVIVWEISKIDDSRLLISHGVYGKKKLNEIIKSTKIKVDEYKSRVEAKRKEGYKEITDLYDNAPTSLPNQEDEYQFLQLHLPKFNTTSEGFVLPMLAKTLEDNKPFDKFGIMPSQWKINGLRCIIGAEINKDDLFKQIRFTYTSREGTRWNLNWMDEILLESIPEELRYYMIVEGICLDGELYLPGYSVNEINSFIKNPKVPQHYKLQYWCYDICMENYSYIGRSGIIDKYLDKYKIWFTSENQHLNNTNQFVVLPNFGCDNIVTASNLRDRFISLGFEGAIFRNPKAEYAFGKRNSSMFKYKRKQDGLFIVVDIKEDKKGLPIYTLRNDINDELFECTINLPQEQQRTQLSIKDELIGKKGLVEYRERSGVKQVPFHAKLVKIFV